MNLVKALKNKKLAQLIISIMAFVVAVVSIVISSFLMSQTNEITKLANLFQIQNVIQYRIDDVSSAKKKYDALEKEYKMLGKKSDEELVDAIFEVNTAVDTFLMSYEFACQLCTNDKIDQVAFDIFVNNTVTKRMLTDHKDKINTESYPGIMQVNKKDIF
jgi:hypothetical protein